ncbi:hypothetical protein TNCV_3190841 [Trichonephila clavipes]|nr:hypothetical protein TNCV_3190841 [Trichonephila clavipes]
MGRRTLSLLCRPVCKLHSLSSVNKQWPHAPVIPQLVDRKTFRDNRWSFPYSSPMDPPCPGRATGSCKERKVARGQVGYQVEVRARQVEVRHQNTNEYLKMDIHTLQKCTTYRK